MSLAAMNWAWGQMVKPGPKLVLMRLADFANEDHEAWPRVRTLAEACSVSEKTARRYVHELETAGLLVRREQRAENGAQMADRYILCVDRETPATDGETGGQIDHLSQNGPVVTGDQPPLVTGDHHNNHQLEPSYTPLTPQGGISLLDVQSVLRGVALDGQPLQRIVGVVVWAFERAGWRADADPLAPGSRDVALQVLDPVGRPLRVVIVQGWRRRTLETHRCELAAHFGAGGTQGLVLMTTNPPAKPGPPDVDDGRVWCLWPAHLGKAAPALLSDREIFESPGGQAALAERVAGLFANKCRTLGTVRGVDLAESLAAARRRAIRDGGGLGDSYKTPTYLGREAALRRQWLPGDGATQKERTPETVPEAVPDTGGEGTGGEG